MRVALIMVLIGLPSVALSAPSRAAIAAEGWVKAMIDPKAIEPLGSVDKGKTLNYVADSPEKACEKMPRGTIKSGAGLKALKSCFIATRKRLGKGQEWKIRELAPAKVSGEAAKYLQTAPKGTVIIESTFSEGPMSMDIVVAVLPDFSVPAVWMSWFEPEDSGE